ncbi:MAG TPA: glycosyltransferase family 2 protein, partial [Planctomycetota bacterium]|nr:glycosyltransferase family 2 protein [Planctomycetota bacterium]
MLEGARYAADAPLRSLHVIVPVLNEAPNLEGLFASFRELAASQAGRYGTCVILVDDGSNDGTPELAAALGHGLALAVLKHEGNMGPGSAFGTAFEHLAGDLEPTDFVATVEGDNTGRVETLLRMLERCEREDLDVVLASPYAYGGGFEHTSWWRRFLSFGANAIVLRGLLGMTGIHTMSSFFRVFRGRAVLALQAAYGPRIIERAGFEGVVEMLKKAMNLRLSISEVPFRLDTAARRGKSRMRILRTIGGYLGLCLAVRRWRLPGPVRHHPGA